MSDRIRRFAMQFRQQESVVILEIHAADDETAQRLLRSDALALAAALEEWAGEPESPCYRVAVGASMPIAWWDGRSDWCRKHGG